MNSDKIAMIKALEVSLGIVTTACKDAGIGRTTHYEWYNNDPEYKAAVDDIQEIALDFVESQHYQNIAKGDTASTIFHLKTKGKKRGYGENVQVGGVKKIIFDDQTDDEDTEDEDDE